MIEADHTMLLSLQREMVEMKRKTEETSEKNEQELQVLHRENEEMKKKLGKGGPSTVPTNVVNSSYTSPPNPGTAEGARDRLPPWETEMDEESCLVRFPRTTVTADSTRRNPLETQQKF